MVLWRNMKNIDQFCYVESAQCLTEAGADISAVNAISYTPIHIAVQHNKLAIVKLFVELNCNVNIRGGGSFTPLHIAAKYGYAEILNYLIDKGAFIECRDTAGNTPIIISARNGQYTTLDALIKAGCDLNSTNDEGYTALHYACQKARGFQMLLDAGANPDICDNQNISPLLMAATEGFDGVVKALVAARCDVNITSSSVKKTALHILAYKGHSECIDELIYGGADINQLDAFNHSPLWYAIKNKRMEVVRLLLRANSDVDTFQCSSLSPEEACPTRLALSLGHLNVVKMFIVTGYDHDHLRDCLQDKELSGWLDAEKDVSHWLDHAAGAQALKQICRRWIRHHLGKQFYHHLHFMPLPQAMKDYLFMKELHDH